MEKQGETGTEGAVGELLIDDAVLAGWKGPWWTQLLRRGSEGTRGAADGVAVAGFGVGCWGGDYGERWEVWDAGGVERSEAGG